MRMKKGTAGYGLRDMDIMGEDDDVMDNGVGAERKKKVLISFVGNHDPYSVSVEDDEQLAELRGADDIYTDDDEGAVLTIIREMRPDIVFLLPSSETKAGSSDNHTEGRAEKIKEILSKRDGAPSCFILPLETDNPADLGKCYKAFKNEFVQMLEIINVCVYGGVKNCELIINTSSGTQQMNHAGRLFLSGAGLTMEFLRVDNPRFAKDRSARVHVVSQRMDEEMVLLRSIESGLDSFQFHSIAASCAVLAERSVLRERQEFAKALRDIFRAYELIDMMNYIKALEKLEKLASRFAETRGQILAELPHFPIDKVLDALDGQISFLRKINAVSESESTHNLTDLFFNMQRAFTRGYYVDVLSRFGRLREGVLYIRLRDRGVTVRNLNRASDVVERLLSAEGYKKHIKHNFDKLIFKGETKDFIKLLTNELGDDEAKAFETEFGGELARLKANRNQTIVAHGMLPVERADAALCIEIGEKLIDLVPGGRKAYEDYPFTKERMRTLVDMLKA